ncbi:Retrovirus-related Pol polyprotein from transposon TNT 1-94 [Gossypium australe]|uniref:Retrovirus-related Pol polyprotein from transposon TNT 1-94 n=1 Tax=Gossypium australe TaxID=47621 RepID=A0A5B6VEI6_9ROSI|nr:Retrovirus-related Pol polyprotein from transposon TNT 1-94 [Gossypium australe]
MGHEAVICKYKNLQQGDEAQVADQEEEDQLFVATCFISHEIEKDTIAITSCSRTKFVTDVLCVPDIDQNLPSVGQLVEKGFKSKVAGVFWKFKKIVENQSGNHIQILRSDNGEYKSENFKAFCEEAGIEHQLTAPYTPQQNGVSERRNKYILDMTRCMLHEKNLPKKFWEEATHNAVFLTVAKAYKFFQSQSGKIVTSRDVHFVEDEKWNWDEKSGQSTADLKLKFPVSTTNKDENWLNELVDDAPTRGTRLLTNIYARCNIAICEPADFLTVIRVKWVYRTKLNVDGSVKKHKARLVVKGYAQVFGVDYSDIFAPVALLDTIRLLLVVAAQMNWNVYQLDEDKVFLLKKALYRLKQAPRAWYNARLLEEFKQEMMKVEHEVFIYQKKYAKEILKKFKLEKCKEVSTLMNQKEKLCKEDGADKVDEGYFRSLIGC